MKPVKRPQSNTRRPGWVYLIRDIQSGEHKVGLTCSLVSRLTNLFANSKRPFELIWAVATNDMGRLEYECKVAWRGWSIRGEWYSLPVAEVARFKGMKVLNWHGTPPVFVSSITPRVPATRSPRKKRDAVPGSVFC